MNVNTRWAKRRILKGAIVINGALCCLAAASLAQTPSGSTAISFSGANPKLCDAHVESGNVYDYTFERAPTDWMLQSGAWKLNNRWGYSWTSGSLHGRSEEVAALWNKRKFSGDQSIQFYFEFQNAPSVKGLFFHLSNVAITICGDGKNLGSGYSFVIGAHENQHSVLLKQGLQVAESTKPEAIFPKVTDDGMSLERFLNQRLRGRQIYAKMNKVGNRIECWLGNKMILAYEDPQPLEGGQVALWTYNNGIALWRVQVFYENEVKHSYKHSYATQKSEARR